MQSAGQGWRINGCDLYSERFPSIKEALSKTKKITAIIGCVPISIRT
jgi:hypothetical protein